MKRFATIFCLGIVIALCGCAIRSNTLFPSDSQGEPPVDPATVTTPAPVPGATTTAPAPPAPASPAPAPPAPASTAGPIRLEGSGGGLLEIQVIPGPYGSAFTKFYVTWYNDEARRFRQFQPLHTLRFPNVPPGEYYLNFEWDTGRWVVENIPPVEAEHRPLNGRLRVRLNEGPWHEFTSADTVRVVNPATNESWWNLRLVVP